MISKRTQLRIFLAAGSLILLGAAAGVTVDRVAHHQGIPVMVEFSRVHGDPVGVIESVITLTPQQRTRIEAILATRQGDIDTAFRDARTRIDAVVNSVVNEIAAELDAEQAARFRQLADEPHGQGHFRPR